MASLRSVVRVLMAVLYTRPFWPFLHEKAGFLFANVATMSFSCVRRKTGCHGRCE